MRFRPDILSFAFGQLFPRRCVICGMCGAGVCIDCESNLKCLGSFSRLSVPTLPPSSISPLTSLGSLYRYDDCSRYLTSRLKLKNQQSAVQWCASRLALMVRAQNLNPSFLSWCVSTDSRQIASGDHSRILAQAVASMMQIPNIRILRRIDNTSQRQSRQLRIAPRFVVDLSELNVVKEQQGSRRLRLLLIDDVWTTGATMRSAAKAITGISGLEVHGITVSRKL